MLTKVHSWYFLLLILAFGQTSSRGAEPLSTESISQLKQEMENRSPAAFFYLSRKVYESGAKDEAVFWYYLGKLRSNAYLDSDRRTRAIDEEIKNASALMQDLGTILDQYAGGDVDRLVRTLDEVLRWDEVRPNPLTPKDQPSYRAARSQLERLRAYEYTNKAGIRSEREKNGLENRH